MTGRNGVVQYRLGPVERWIVGVLGAALVAGVGLFFRSIHNQQTNQSLLLSKLDTGLQLLQRDVGALALTLNTIASDQKLDSAVLKDHETRLRLLEAESPAP